MPKCISEGTKYMVCTVKNMVQSQAISAQAVFISSLRKSDKVKIASVWLDGYVNRIGDRMPHTEKINLPCFLTKKIIYQQMTDELSQQGHMKELLSLSHLLCSLE